MSQDSAAVSATYTADIRPKFRPGDIACMAKAKVQLDDAHWMCDPGAAFGFPDHGNARKVFEVLAARTMPPDGPWPQAWLDVFQAWMAGGFRP